MAKILHHLYSPQINFEYGAPGVLLRHFQLLIQVVQLFCPSTVDSMVNYDAVLPSRDANDVSSAFPSPSRLPAWYLPFAFAAGGVLSTTLRSDEAIAQAIQHR